MQNKKIGKESNKKNHEIEIIIPSIEEIIEINKKFSGSVINRGSLEFLVSKIESKYRDENFKKQVAKISAIILTHLTHQHPFINGNKRTAMETMNLFLKKNNFILDTTTAGKVYISLKLANDEMDYEEVVKWIYEHVKEVKE